MAYRALITNTTTGETRTWSADGPLDDDARFLWAEGNYSCDCNREILWHLAAGHDCTLEHCSEGRFTVRLEDGEAT